MNIHKKLLITILGLLFSTVAYGAELLVKAQEPWNNDLNTSKMTVQELQSFNARSRKGDIIVVRPDGWKWGRMECLPQFVVIKIPDLKYEDAKQYEQSLYDTIDPQNPIMLKVRKFQIPNVAMSSVLSIPKAEKDAFISNIITKTQ